MALWASKPDRSALCNTNQEVQSTFALLSRKGVRLYATDSEADLRNIAQGGTRLQNLCTHPEPKGLDHR